MKVDSSANTLSYDYSISLQSCVSSLAALDLDSNKKPSLTPHAICMRQPSSHARIREKKPSPESVKVVDPDLQGIATQQSSAITIRTWLGTGPSGVHTLNARSKSNAAIKAYCPHETRGSIKAIEFIYDTKTKTFAVGRPKDNKIPIGLSPHQRLAVSIGAERKYITFLTPGIENVVGGLFTRFNGVAYTSENSGHFIQNWTDERRVEFVETMKSYGVDISHSGDIAFDPL